MTTTAPAPKRLSAGDVLAGLGRLDPMLILERCAHRSGGLGRLATIDGRRILVVSDRDLLHKILVSEADTFDKGGPTYDILAQRKPGGVSNGILDGGPFTQNDAAIWRRQRELINPFFQSAQMVAVAQGTVRALQGRMASWLSDVPVSLLHEFKQVSIDVLSEHLFGAHIDHATKARIASVAPRYFERMAMRLVLPAWFPGSAGYEKIGAEFERVIEDIIDIAYRNSDRFADTLLGRSMAAFDAEQDAGLRIVKGMIGTFYLAGFDSAAVVQAQACIELARNQTLQARLRAEVDRVLGNESPTLDKLNQLLEVRAFWQATLHRHAAFKVIFRNVVRDCELNGWEFRAGDQLFLALDALHHDPKHWGSRSDLLALFRQGLNRDQRLAHIPYGQGAKKCVGAPMADAEALATIALVLQGFELRRPWPNLGQLKKLAMTSPLVDSRVFVARRS